MLRKLLTAMAVLGVVDHSLCGEIVVSCGGVDDDAALHAGLAALTTANRVLKLDGDCVQRTDMVVTMEHVTIRGDAWGATTLRAKNGAGILAMIALNANHGTVRELTIDGNRRNGGTLSYNGYTAGIQINAPFATVFNTEIKEVGFQGILGWGANTGGSDVHHNYIHHNGDIALLWGSGYKHVFGADDVRVSFNRFEHNYGLDGHYGGSAVAMDVSGLTMVGNYMLNNYNFGGQVAENGIGGAQRRWAISANQMVVQGEPAGAETAGVEMTGLFAAITGNIIAGGRGAAAVWESANGAVAGDSVFVGNFVDKWVDMGTGVMAINPDAYMPRDIVVDGNKFRGAYGFFATAGYGFLVGDNNFNDVTVPYHVIGGATVTYGTNVP